MGVLDDTRSAVAAEYRERLEARRRTCELLQARDREVRRLLRNALPQAPHVATTEDLARMVVAELSGARTASSGACDLAEAERLKEANERLREEVKALRPDAEAHRQKTRDANSVSRWSDSY